MYSTKAALLSTIIQINFVEELHVQVKWIEVINTRFSAKTFYKFCFIKRFSLTSHLTRTRARIEEQYP